MNPDPKSQGMTHHALGTIFSLQLHALSCAVSSSRKYSPIFHLTEFYIDLKAQFPCFLGETYIFKQIELAAFSVGYLWYLCKPLIEHS